ncbi:MAG: FHA domain-containing protein [Chloroflexi bacterium]|nr:FHA domain-containing protein [Chloroflexota bacterium]
MIRHWLLYTDVQGSRTIPLTPPGPLCIGRAADCTVHLDATYAGHDPVSAHHAELYWWNGVGWVLRDLDSTNGVYVDGQRSGHNRLAPNCLITVGQVHLRFIAQMGADRTR